MTMTLSEDTLTILALLEALKPKYNHIWDNLKKLKK